MNVSGSSSGKIPIDAVGSGQGSQIGGISDCLPAMISAVSHRLPAGADSPFWANDYDNEKPRRIQRLAFAAALAAIVERVSLSYRLLSLAGHEECDDWKNPQGCTKLIACLIHGPTNGPVRTAAISHNDPDESRKLKTGTRVCYNGDPADLGTVTATETWYVTIKWDDGHRSFTGDKNMQRVE